jgi:hypothetical protein
MSARIVAADFNGDGNLDVAVTYLGTTTGVAVLSGKGNGTFHAPVVLGGTDPNWIAVGDLNRDGRPDIVVNGVTIYINNGKGWFAPPVTPRLCTQPAP